jgi:hypothetical protein
LFRGKDVEQISELKREGLHFSRTALVFFARLAGTVGTFLRDWCDAAIRDVSKVQNPDEGGEGTHLSQAAKADVSGMHQSEHAKTKVRS